MEPIRVLMVFTIMNRGGAESMVMNYYRNIDRRRMQFDFLVHRNVRGDYDDEIERLGGRIFRMRSLNPLTFNVYKRDVAHFFDEHHEYEIIHGHCSELGYFIYKEASKRSVPVIIAHAHNSHAMCDIKLPFRLFFKYGMKRYITSEFTCGYESAEWLFGQKDACKAFLQNNAIDASAYSFSHSERSEMRQALGLNEDAFVVGHVGRFQKQKNHSFILHVFSSILKRKSEAYLLLIGDGELKETIQTEATHLGIKERILFLGKRDDVANLLQTMDVFLFPSFMEGLSLSMIEAQCSGLPCLVSDTIPREVNKTGRVTFMSLKKSADEWAMRAIGTAQESVDRAIYCKRVVDAGYDIKENAEKLEKTYIKLLYENK